MNRNSTCTYKGRGLAYLHLGRFGSAVSDFSAAHGLPPDGVEVVSSYVMMGIGQDVSLRFPTSRLREANLAMEQCAWGAFETEFYALYDFQPVLKNLKAQHT